MGYIGGGMYQTEPCPLCGETLWNGRCENPDCHYHWHPKDDEAEDDESNPGKLHRTDDDSIYAFCNSLNAIYHPLCVAGMTTAAHHVLRAQGVITRLYEENKELKRKLKESEEKPNGKV